jgi:hypothetical protein
MMKRSLGPKIFFAIFGFFGRYVTNLRGTFVENVKKVKNQPTLVYSTLSIVCSIFCLLVSAIRAKVYLNAVMGTHSFICYFVTATVTLLVMAVTNKFLFSSACNEVMEAIGDLKNDYNVTVSFWRT